MLHSKFPERFILMPFVFWESMKSNMHTFPQHHILNVNSEQIVEVAALALRPLGGGGGVDIPKRIITEPFNNAEKIDVSKLCFGYLFWEIMGVGC